MENKNKNLITIETLVDAPIAKVWETFTQPEHIVNWNFASEDWCSPKAENDLQVGGKFSLRMEAKDGSFGFDFEGTYTEIKEHELIVYKLADDRTVRIEFTSKDEKTHVKEVFGAEDTNPIELQQKGWQSILNNFKKYTESLS